MGGRIFTFDTRTSRGSINVISKDLTPNPYTESGYKRGASSNKDLDNLFMSDPRADPLGIESCPVIFADQGITACHPTFRHGRAQPWLRTRGS